MRRKTNYNGTTCPRLAAAIGRSSNSLNKTSMEQPNSFCMKDLAFSGENAGTLSYLFKKLILILVMKDSGQTLNTSISFFFFF